MADEPKLKVYGFGQGGVQLVKDPLQLSDDELQQAQNGEIRPDVNTGGVGGFSKRGGLIALTSALAGSILGILGLPLQTTYTRTLYASLGSLDADRWLSSTDGTTWVATQTPIRATRLTGDTISTGAHGSSKAAVAWKNGILYPSDVYTQDLTTPANNTPPPLAYWDGTRAVELLTLATPVGCSDGNYPFKITDMLSANGKIYFGVHSSPNTAVIRGAVLALDMTTGKLAQVANIFGGGTSEQGGGAPACLEWYMGQLWVGLNAGDGTASVGTVCRCYPDSDSAWTADTTALGGYPMSMRQYHGDLYVGARGNGTNDAAVYKRTAATGAWSTSDTISTSGTDYYSGLVVFNDLLFATVYSDGGTDVERVRVLSAGSWSTDLDITVTYTSNVAHHVGQPQVFGGALYLPYEESTEGAGDGFILKRTTGGVWTRPVNNESINGRLVTLLSRS